MEKVGDGYKKIEGYCSTGQSPQRAVVPMEKEEEEIFRFLESNENTNYSEISDSKNYCRHIITVDI